MFAFSLVYFTDGTISTMVTYGILSWLGISDRFESSRFKNAVKIARRIKLRNVILDSIISSILKMLDPRILIYSISYICVYTYQF